MIDINTKFITLIGTPLEQSFAARMQNAAYAASNLNYCYFYTDTGSTHLGEILNGIRYMPSFAGCAITKPNKVEAIQYLDELEPFCAKSGACNTVVKDGDRLIGYNTDGTAFIRSLKLETGISPDEKVFFCFGAGGAGRAICSILAYNGAKQIYISDIRQEAADALVNDINVNFAPVAVSVPYGEYAAVEEATVIINASGIGMGKTIGQSPLPEEFIGDQLFFDACYNPDKTQFLLNAERKGCRILNGLGMSLYQAITQIELWTGMEAPVEVMQNELICILRDFAWEESHSDSCLFRNIKSSIPFSASQIIT